MNALKIKENMEDKSKNIGCLGFLFSFLNKKETDDKKEIENSDKQFKYTKNEKLLSLSEISFFHILKQIFPQEYNVFSKVRLADIISVKGKKWQQGFNKIKAKHIDYVITEASTSKILLAIELDDSSHNTERAQKNDMVKDNALKEAGLPLLRIKAQKNYNTESIKEEIEKSWA